MTFPATAKILVNNFVQNVSGSVERVQMSDGNAKQGRARHFDQTSIPVSYLMTELEFAQFQSFHSGTLSNGAHRFDWTNPANGVAVQARIVGGKYRATPHKRFRGCSIVDFELEIFI